MEKREHIRLPKHFRVELHELTFPVGDSKGHEVNTLDISAGGILVESGTGYAVGDKVTVKIYIAGFNKFHSGFLKVFESDAGQYLQAIAEVVRVDEQCGQFRIGIRFLDVHEDDFSALERFIKKTAGAESAAN